MKWRVMIVAFWNAGFSNSAFAQSVPPPLPYVIGGTITVNGSLLTQANAGSDYLMFVTKLDNTELNPSARTSSLTSQNAYVINIPTYDATSQLLLSRQCDP